MNTVHAEFTRMLLDHLTKSGYTHIISHGTGYGNNTEESEEYWLEPLKPGDIRLTAEETSYHINKITDGEVLEMVHGDEFIKFLVVLSIEEYEEYLKVK